MSSQVHTSNHCMELHSSTIIAGKITLFSGDCIVFIYIFERLRVHELNSCNIKLYYKQHFRSRSSCQLLTGVSFCNMSVGKCFLCLMSFFFAALPRLTTSKESLHLHIASQVFRSIIQPVVHTGVTLAAPSECDPEVKSLVSCCVLWH